MKPFVRPSIDLPAFHDAAGSVIDYGRRWWPTGDDGPDDTYSVTRHPERFAPLRVVAQALVEHLDETYDVTRSISGDTTVLTPGGSAAPLRLEVTSFPFVRCTAGIATGIAWFCACDHCDEDIVVIMDALEEQVAIVVDGGLREWLEDTDDGLYAHRDLTPPGGQGHSSGSSRIKDGQQDAARNTYAQVPDRWAPWPLRSDS